MDEASAAYKCTPIIALRFESSCVGVRFVFFLRYAKHGGPHSLIVFSLLHFAGWRIKWLAR